VNSHRDGKVRGSRQTEESRGRIYCFVKFPNKLAHANTRGSTRTMVHECVRRARTMVQLRMYRRLLLSSIIPPGIVLETRLSLLCTRAAKTSRPSLLRFEENFRCFPYYTKRCRKSRITEAFYVKSTGYFIPG